MMFACSSALLVIIFGMLTVTSVKDAWLSDLTESTIATVDQINEKAALMFDEFFSTLELFDNSTTRSFLDTYGYRYEKSKALVQMITLYRDSGMLDNANNVYIIRTDGRCMSEHQGLHYLERYSTSQRVAEQALEAPDAATIIYTEDENTELMLTRTVYELVSKRILGYIVIIFDGEAASEICRQAFSPAFGEFALVDKQRNMLPASSGGALYEAVSQELDGTEGALMHRLSDDSLFVSSTVRDHGWRIAGIVELNFIKDIDEKISGLWGVAALVWAGLLTFMIFFISRRVTAPISRLKNNMLEARAGNLTVRAASDGTTEVSQLADCFNSMLNQIKNLMEQERQKQEKIQKAELARLQSEINPHFLYNTLETVIWLTADHRNDEAIDVTESLAAFFRIGLSDGADYIKISQEIEYSKSYLKIQHARYNDKLTYSFDVSGELYDYDILKLTVQPIIENALYHGIGKKAEGGHISVRGFASNGDIVFVVRDNGVGISPQQVKQMNQMLQSDSFISDASSGYGMYNVNRRIKLHYGDKYGVSVSSTQDLGTEVRITIKRVAEHV